MAAALLAVAGVADALRLVVRPRVRRSSRPATSWGEAWREVLLLARLVVECLVLRPVLRKALTSVRLEAWPLLTRHLVARLPAQLLAVLQEQLEAE